MLQHILEDTAEFIRLVAETGTEIFAIVVKPFSKDQDVLDRLKQQSHRIVQESYSVLDNTNLLDDLLVEANAACAKDGKRVLVLEVGGYFASPLSRLSRDNTQYVAGVVEVTTFGHNRYKRLVKEISVPVFSVARSPIKSLEAKYVGLAAVSAMEQIMRERGVSLPGRQALVIGFGMIGKSVANALRAQNLLVSVYDKKSFAQLDAFTMGYKIGSKRSLLRDADIIFSATAERALMIEDMAECKDGSLLVSVGSKGNEYDVEGLKLRATNAFEISEHITRYKITQQKSINLIRNGTAVNFTIKSCPDEIVDLIFAEVLVCSGLLLSNQ